MLPCKDKGTLDVNRINTDTLVPSRAVLAPLFLLALAKVTIETAAAVAKMKE
jgi:hypothetical protein